MKEVQITRQDIIKVKEALDNNDLLFVKSFIKPLHPIDLAHILPNFNSKHSKILFANIDRNQDAVDVLISLDEDIRNNILSEFIPEEIKNRFIGNMDSDDAADIVNELPEDIKNNLINLLNKSKEDEDKELIELLDYKEDTAGGLMAKELIKVNINWNVNQCIDELRTQVQEVEKVYTVYVVDDDDILKGFIHLKKLVLSTSSMKIKDIYNSEIVWVELDTAGEEVAQIMNKYELVTCPVVDYKRRLVGRITIDDVVNFIKDEAEEDYQLMSGIVESVESTDKIWILTRARLPWLFLGLIGGILAAKVIGVHEESIKIYPEMAFFIPLIIGMAGNAGVQSSAIIVQNIAANTLGHIGFFYRIFKEFLVALLNGIVLSIILFGYGMIVGSIDIALIASISLISVIIFASLLGVIIPLFLQQLKIDPALATGPFITTSNDIIGLTIYFYIGHIFYQSGMF